MTSQDRADLPSQEELDEIERLAMHTGVSLNQLMHLRNTVLHAAAEKLRAWNGPDFIEERWATGMEDAADFIDPGVTQ